MKLLISLDITEGTTWEQVQKAIAGGTPANTKLDVVPGLLVVDSYGARGVLNVVDETTAVNYQATGA